MIQHNRINPTTGDRAKEALCVFLVDDNPWTVKLAAYVMRQAGWDVHPHTSPSRALAELESVEPDLIITDFQMPEMNGPEFLLAAEQLHPATPTLVMTAFDDDPAVQSVLRKASIPCVSKTKGLTRIAEVANALVSVRRAVKRKTLSVVAT